MNSALNSVPSVIRVPCPGSLTYDNKEDTAGQQKDLLINRIRMLEKKLFWFCAAHHREIIGKEKISSKLSEQITKKTEEIDKLKNALTNL